MLLFELSLFYCYCNNVFKVCSNSGQEYICPTSLQFCPCLSFSFGVVKRGELVMVSLGTNLMMQ